MLFCGKILTLQCNVTVLCSDCAQCLQNICLCNVMAEGRFLDTSFDLKIQYEKEAQLWDMISMSM